jgi:hypothetical protein
MNATDSAVLPLGEMEDRDVTESDQELWITTRPIEVQAFCNAVRTLAASCGEDDFGLAKGKSAVEFREGS